jgi:hypothetical protein
MRPGSTSVVGIPRRLETEVHARRYGVAVASMMGCGRTVFLTGDVASRSMPSDLPPLGRWAQRRPLPPASGVLAASTPYRYTTRRIDSLDSINTAGVV